MKKSDTTARFPQAFASQADSSVVAYPLPDTKQASGRVSLLNGFPLENFTALSAGGVPPSGADFNGLFRTLTEAIRANETGQIRAFNADYAQKIGGYPQSALVTDPANPARLLISTQDDNKTNPASDTSGAWVPVADGISALQDGLAAEKQAREDAVNAERNRAQTAEAGLQPKGFYVTTSPNQHQTAVDILNVETATGTPWVHSIDGQFIRLQKQGQYVTTSPNQYQTAVDILNVETATGTPWVHSVDGQFIRLQKQGNYPEISGIAGRVVIQSFVARVSDQSPRGYIAFPQIFAPGTQPFVMCAPVTEHGTEITSITDVKQNSDGTLQITNAGFNYYRTTGTGNSLASFTVPVIAIGTAP